MILNVNDITKPKTYAFLMELAGIPLYSCKQFFVNETTPPAESSVSASPANNDALNSDNIKIVQNTGPAKMIF